MSCELHITSYHIYMDPFESIYYVLREREMEVYFLLPSFGGALVPRRSGPL